MERRRVHVRRLLKKGYNSMTIAAKLGVHRHTIRKDLHFLGISRFSKMGDYDLNELVAGELLDSHLALGFHALEARLSSLEFHVQRRRLRASRSRLGVTNKAPKSAKRLKWYEARGPDCTRR
jgi:hypothetical protein